MSCKRSGFKPNTRISTHALRLLFLIACLAIFSIRQADAASVPVGFVDATIATGITSPTSMTVLPDERVLVVQQDGIIRMIKGDTLSPTNFYAVQNVDTFSERGCLGAINDPNFAVNHYIYLYCTITDGTNSANRILRVTEASDVALPGSEQVILTLPNVPAGVQWHMGGAMRFGPDGKLYVAVGGHEDFWVPPETSFSQSLASPFGKILRINADGSVPPDNPFVNTPGAYPAIFNLGFRNPFTFDFQPGTGLMFINDVGAASWEEINRGIPGANYGWPATEGIANDSRYTNPLYTYSHSNGCAITGGAFYNPLTPQFSAAYIGKYFFADFCSGEIRSIDPANPATASVFASGIGNPVNLGVAPSGSLYYLARNQDAGTVNTAAGTVSKISFTNSQVPRIATQPQSQTIFLGDPATFTVKADGATSIQWQRNGVNIPGATLASYTIARTALTDNQASFTAVTSNSFGVTSSTPAVLAITTNHLPVATITSPAEGSGFSAGDVITYSGTGTDAEDGTLPPAAFTWQVDFRHDTHAHPFMAATSGATGGSFSVPTFEADAANTWLRISLTVKDSQGQTSTVTRDIYPRTQIGDMTPAGTPTNGLGPIEKNMHNGGAAAGDGGTITLGRIPYAKGLGVHAPSDVRFNLGGACTGKFIADVGIDDSVGGQGSVVFQVLLDGEKVFDSGIMHGNAQRQGINVSVAGKNELRLVVTDAGDGNTFDQADWAAAHVTGCPASFATSGGGAALTSSTDGGGDGGGGGGGCSIGGDGRFDPTLPAMLVAAIAALGWRRRSERRGAAPPK